MFRTIYIEHLREHGVIVTDLGKHFIRNVSSAQTGTGKTAGGEHHDSQWMVNHYNRVQKFVGFLIILTPCLAYYWI